MKLKITILSICLLVLGNLTMAQTNTPTSTSPSSNTGGTSNYGMPKAKDFDRFSAGISFGVNYFQSDIQKNSENNNSFKDLPFDIMYGAHLAYQLTHTTGIRLSGMFGKFSAENRVAVPGYPNAQVNFGRGYEAPYTYESDVKEGTLEATFTLGNISFLNRNKKFHFIGSIGGGMFNFDGTLKTDSLRLASPDTGIESLTLKTGNVTEGMAVLGLGFKYQIGKRMDIGVTWNFRKTFTDKVDRIDKPTTESDNYSILMLNLNYTFGKKAQQMEWVNPMEVVYNDMAELKDKMDVLSGDKDKDGVSDMFDKDNSTAEGTKVYGDGTSVDTDGDGIPDSKDSDPYTNKGAKVDANGVEADADGDGVPDSKDLEPNTPKGSLVNFQGIALDKALESKMGGGIGWLPSVLFDLNKSEIKGVQRDRVLIVARVLMNNPNVKLKIIGNTDPSAGEDYNQKLGMRRAEAVKKQLVKVYGIDETRLTTESKGEKEIIAKGMYPMDRRVDFEVQK